MLLKQSDWYAVQVRPRFEAKVAMRLTDQGYELLVPMYASRRAWSDRTVTRYLPLFPGYVFCRVNDAVIGKIVTTSGVVRIVGDGTRPLPLTESEAAALKALVQRGRCASPHPFFDVGETVEITTGPLRGVRGRVERMGNGTRLIVSIPMLQRSAVIDVSADDVGACSP